VHGEREGCSAEEASASEPRSPRYRREYVPQSELACGGGSGGPGPPARVRAGSWASCDATSVGWSIERGDAFWLAPDRESGLPKTRARTPRRYQYLTLLKENRESPHLVRERVRCGKPSCRCAQDLRDRHGPYLYLRYEEYDRRTGQTHYRREYVPTSELARVRAWVRRFRTERARGRAVMVVLRRYVAEMEYRGRRRARL
jgi:hypothetical protein